MKLSQLIKIIKKYSITELLSIVKDENLPEVAVCDNSELEENKFQDGTGTIFRLEDGYVILIETESDEAIYWELGMGAAQKTAIEMLYKHSKK